MSKQPQRFVEFGPYRMDLDDRLLVRDGQPVPLSPKVFELLLVFVENAGRLVEKEELRKQLWPDTFVEDNTLVQDVFVLRKILGATGDGGKYIETVPKSGYRFVAPVRRIAPARSHRWIWIAAPALMALAIAIALALSRREPVWFQKVQLSALTGAGRAVHAAISPDGRLMAYVARTGSEQGLWVMRTGDSQATVVVPPAEERFQGLTFSPDGGSVYYIRSFSLYQIPSLGGAVPRKLLDGVDRPVRFSPDGRRIAFVREDLAAGVSQVVLANADGTAPMKLAERKLPLYFRLAAWAPDGKRLACTAGKKGETAGRMTLVTVEIASGREQPLGSSRWTLAGELAWLADGSGVLMAARGESSEPSQIWHISFPQGSARRITNDLDEYHGVSLTADSRSLVTVQAGLQSSLWVVSANDGGSARQLTSGTARDTNPSWTPDGGIIYASHTGGKSQIWHMQADGGAKRQLSYDSCNSFAPWVSADGRYIVYVSDCSGSQDIWKMARDGSARQQLAHGANADNPVVSPDGRWVVYKSTPRGKPTLWKVSIDGGNPVPLTQHLSRRPAISPDGQFVACYFWDEQPGSSARIAVLFFSDGRPVKTFAIPETSNPVVVRWSPSGKDITYIGSRPGITTIWSQPLSGGSPRKLVGLQGSQQILDFNWSHDGSKLVLARSLTQEDVILIRDVR